MDYVTAPETLHYAKPAPEGPLVDVLALRVGGSVLFNTFTPAVRALLQRCRDGRRPQATLLDGIPRDSVPTAQRLIDMFAANQLTAFEAPPPTQAEEIASLKLQGAMKDAAASQQVEA